MFRTANRGTVLLYINPDATVNDVLDMLSENGYPNVRLIQKGTEIKSSQRNFFDSLPDRQESVMIINIDPHRSTMPSRAVSPSRVSRLPLLPPTLSRASSNEMIVYQQRALMREQIANKRKKIEKLHKKIEKIQEKIASLEAVAASL